jgi:YggT family protein
MIAGQIMHAVATCFYVYYLMLLARCLLSFLPTIDWDNPPFKWLKDSVDIYLDLFKRFIPPIGPFDLSPILAFFALGILQYIVLYMLKVIFTIIGL